MERREEGCLDLQAFPNDRLHRVVVVAGPGHGKSALLTAIAGEFAEGPLVPVSIPLASLASADSSIISFLSSSMNMELDLSADWQRLAEQGLLVLLLDGLDEVPSGERPKLLQRIELFSGRYSRAAWMLTVRDPGVVTGLGEAVVVELLPLDDEDIKRFATAMRKYVGDVEPWEFVHRLRLYPDLDRPARIPLFLMMLLASFDFTNPEARTRSDLIEAYLKTLFFPAQHKVLGDSVDRSVALRAIAEELASNGLSAKRSVQLSMRCGRLCGVCRNHLQRVTYCLSSSSRTEFSSRRALSGFSFHTLSFRSILALATSSVTTRIV